MKKQYFIAFVLVLTLAASFISAASACNAGTTHAITRRDARHVGDTLYGIKGTASLYDIAFDQSTTGNSAEQWSQINIMAYDSSAGVEVALMKEHDGTLGIFACSFYGGFEQNWQEYFTQVSYTWGEGVNLVITKYNGVYLCYYQLPGESWVQFWSANIGSVRLSVGHTGAEGRGHIEEVGYSRWYSTMQSIDLQTTSGGTWVDFNVDYDYNAMSPPGTWDWNVEKYAYSGSDALLALTTN